MAQFLPRSVRLWLIFLFVIAISHVLTTLWLAGTRTAADYERFIDGLPRNRFTVLQTLTPETQRLPFMMPEAHYAVCPFDTSRGRVLLNVTLDGPGWVLSLHAPDGSMIYYAPGSDGREVRLRLVLIPPGDQFLGMPVGGLGQGPELPEVPLAETRGVAILRVPLYGRSYAAIAVNALKRSSCELVLPRRQSRTARR